MLMGSGAIIVLINLAGGWWFIRRFVLAPVEALTAATEGLGRGDLASRVNLAGERRDGAAGPAFRRHGRVPAAIRPAAARQRGLSPGAGGRRTRRNAHHRPWLPGPACNESYRRLLGLDAPTAMSLPCHAASFRREAPCPPTLVTCPLHEMRGRNEPVQDPAALHPAGRPELEVEVYAAPLHVRGKAGGTARGRVHPRPGAQVRWSHEQKLSELGKLAAGVAHEIHNPLASVKFALHAVRAALPATQAAEVAAPLAIVDEEIDSCINITERLLKLSVAPSAEPTLVDLKVAAGETLSLLRWEAESAGDRPADGPRPTAARRGQGRRDPHDRPQSRTERLPRDAQGRHAARDHPARGRPQIADRIPGHRCRHPDRGPTARYSIPSSAAGQTARTGTGLGLSISRSLVKRFTAS